MSDALPPTEVDPDPTDPATATAAPAAAPDLLAEVAKLANERMGDTAVQAMASGNVAAAAIAIADVLKAIDANEMVATLWERAYFIGALGALQGVLLAEQV